MRLKVFYLNEMLNFKITRYKKVKNIYLLFGIINIIPFSDNVESTLQKDK